jgi:glycosyltransferase involved in cell wall biosynthesis
MGLSVTVAICTWNRAKLLDQTLDRLRQLRIPDGVTWELLVVNNNCSDDTDAVLGRHAGRLPLRRLFEPQPGLSHARNCAVRAARGELLLWTDDDILADEGWLAAYVRAARDWPDAAFFGGPVGPWFAVPPPAWIARNLDILAGTYALRPVRGESRPLGPREEPFGANMAFRADVLRRFPFDTELGRKKDSLMSGEDIDVIDRMRKASLHGVWVGDAFLQHYLPKERLTREYIKEWFRGAGRTNARWVGPQPHPYLWGVPRWVWRKYVTAVAASWVLAPVGGRAWLRAYTKAAFARGMIQEARADRPSDRGGAGTSPRASLGQHARERSVAAPSGLPQEPVRS